MKVKAVCVILASVLLFSTTAFSGTINVPVDYPTIQEGIDVARDGDLVLVGAGTYVENIDFVGKEITVQSEHGQDNTTIDGNQTGAVATFNTGEPAGTILDGFTIQNGSGNYVDAWDAYLGGGIDCTYYSSPTIMNCVIDGNMADFGGGICYWYATFPELTNCVVSNNTASNGGGIYCEYSSLTVMDCAILGNAGNYGGGISLHHYFGDPVVMNCIISNNASVVSGGGFLCGDDAVPTIANCTITGNSTEFGGGLYCLHGASPIITHCTFSENNADIGGGIACFNEAAPFVTNCIFWENTSPEGPEIWIGKSDKPATLSIEYSDVRGGETGIYISPDCPDCTYEWLDGNINDDPLFFAEEDYHLSSGSPCIDTATDAGISFDIDGDIRPQGAGFDMGSDEWVCWDDDEDGYYDDTCGGNDCDDGDPSVYPWAYEVCDLKDNDCNQVVDDNTTDVDGDHYNECLDCNDLNPNICPNDITCPDVSVDGIDQNCDGRDGPGPCFVYSAIR